MFVAVIKYFI